MTPPDDSKAKKLTLDDDQDDQKEKDDEIVDDQGDVDSSDDQGASDDQHVQMQKLIDDLQQQLEKAHDSERRALADYQNVVRRAQEEKSKLFKLAGKDVIQAVLLPLDHLHLAKEQLKDHGLDMVYQQFQQALAGQGVQEIDAIGQPFDENKMEVVDKRPVNDPVQVNVVVGVTQRGYTLNGEILRHARVVIGVPAEKA